MKRKHLLYLIFAILLISCKNNSLADRSFATQKPCTAPCWYGLQINQSNEEEVLSTFKSLDFIQKDSIKKQGTTWLDDNNAIEYWFNCSHPSKSNCGGVVLSRAELKQIRMTINYDLNIQETTELYGVPDYVDYGDYHPESPGCYIAFHWPKTNLIAVYVSANNGTYCEHISSTNSISTKTPISYVLYLDKDGFISEPSCCTRITDPSFDP